MVEINHMGILIAFLVILDIYSTCVDREKGGELMLYMSYDDMWEDDYEGFPLDSDVVFMDE